MDNYRSQIFYSAAKSATKKLEGYDRAVKLLKERKMVDSRQKGARAETALAKKLKEDTELNWKRVPQSGALHEDHKLKGDLYVPGEYNYWCVEVKHYKDDHLTSKLLTNKNPQLLEWWKQTIREANQVDKSPILFFKFDRSKWFVAHRSYDLDMADATYEWKYLKFSTGDLEVDDLFIMSYDTWCSEVLQYINWIK